MKTMCETSNVKLVYKDDITKQQKKYMYKTSIQNPELVVQYAMGDLMNYEARQGHIEQLQKLYTLLELEEYFKGTKATIGMCVFDILQASMMKEFEFERAEELREFVFEASHSSLIENRSSTQIYLAKTNGGRCYNNRPTDSSVHDLIADVDIAGCYSTGMDSQRYPIGRPVIIEYNKKSKINEYDSLKNFLKNYESELVDGLWFCRITTKEVLSFEQDFFFSWYPPNKVMDILKTDYEKEMEGVSPTENDQTRIYSNEIHLGVLQQDGLEWIKNCLCKEQREEFLEKVQVIAAAFYPRSLEKKTLEEFKREAKKQSGRNVCKAYIKASKQVIVKKHSMENHCWYSTSLGDMLITKLSKLRKQYSKEIKEEANMNQFIKLIINTIYGDLVSPHFYIANTIVGNNITARVRTMAWYMEKALHGLQTITDGCAFQINKVTKSRYTLTNAKCFNLKNNGSMKDLGYGYLLNRKVKTSEIGDYKLLKKEINESVKEHIKRTFPKAKVVGQFEIEVRDIYTGIATHGPSNYQLYYKEKIVKTKMRSYKNYEYIDFNIETKKTEGEFSRTVRWLDSIYNKQNAIERQEPFVEEVIIKTSQYLKQKERLDTLGIGDVDHRVRIVNEFNIAMFLFKTNEQYESWKREHDELKQCCKQSYEGSFEGGHGELLYQDMIEDVQKKIKNGKKSFYGNAKLIKDHPKKEKIEKIEEYIREKITP